MAVAGYVFDKHPAPPELLRAWDYQAYGVNVLELPAGELPHVKLANNSYRAMAGYKHAGAGKTVAWSRANPDEWAFVASVLEVRLNTRKAQRLEDSA